MKENSNAGA